MNTLSVILLVLACLLEALAAFNAPVKMNLVAAGLAAYFLSLLLAGLPH